MFVLSTADSETLTRGALLCAENFKLDFYQSLWEICFEKKNCLELLKKWTIFVFWSTFQNCSKKFLYKYLTEFFFLVHFCLLFTFLSCQFFHRRDTARCGYKHLKNTKFRDKFLKVRRKFLKKFWGLKLSSKHELKLYFHSHNQKVYFTPKKYWIS